MDEALLLTDGAVAIERLELRRRYSKANATAVASTFESVHRSRLVLRELANRVFDRAALRNARVLERIRETDPGNVRAREELRWRMQLVEELPDYPPNQVLAEVRDLRVLVHAKDAIRLRHRSLD